MPLIPGTVEQTINVEPIPEALFKRLKEDTAMLAAVLRTGVIVDNDDICLVDPRSGSRSIAGRLEETPGDLLIDTEVVAALYVVAQEWLKRSGYFKRWLDSSSQLLESEGEAVESTPKMTFGVGVLEE